jgi:hypothetical protein
VAHIGAEVAQGVDGGRAGVAGEGAHSVAGGEQGAGRGTTLGSGGPGDRDGEHGSSGRMTSATPK